MILVGIAFGSVAIAHLIADYASLSIHDSFSAILADNPNSPVKYLSSLEKGFFWIVVVATALGVGMSFTKAKEYEGKLKSGAIPAAPTRPRAGQPGPRTSRDPA